jgi:NADPH:quinone reductase-like Zn-dependent oxidoreductase
MIDLDEGRLAVAERFGATATVNSSDGKAAETVMKLTTGLGVDTAIEAVGVPATFELCQQISPTVSSSTTSSMPTKPLPTPRQRTHSRCSSGLDDDRAAARGLRCMRRRRHQAVAAKRWAVSEAPPDAHWATVSQRAERGFA